MKPKLIVHIGQGKTGSTAIQNALNTQREALGGQGLCYLGHMLEHAQNDSRKGWQTPAAVDKLLHHLPDDQVTKEVFDVLNETLENLSTTGTRTVVWSNEALFMRRLGVGPALEKLKSAGWPVEILAYLRRHDKWAQSAYAQWGVRHKSYTGSVLTFRDWIAKRPVRYAEALEFWHDLFGDDLTVVNFDETPDVTLDFASRINADFAEVPRVYETPRNDILTAWAVHNSRFDQEVLPGDYMRILNAAKLLHGNSPDVPEPSELFPSDGDLAQVLLDAEDDIARVNSVMKQTGGTPFETGLPMKAKPTPSHWDMTRIMLTMLSAQQEQIIRLRKRVEALEK